MRRSNARPSYAPGNRHCGPAPNASPRAKRCTPMPPTSLLRLPRHSRTLHRHMDQHPPPSFPHPPPSFPRRRESSQITCRQRRPTNWTRESALIELTRARLECCGPVTEAQFAELFEASATEISVALLALQNEGYAMQGQFSPDAVETEWCERGLLARMHRYTIQSLRQEIQPVPVADYMRFLFAWHGMGEIRPEGDSALVAALEKLEGYSIPAAAWEKDILPARLNDYSGAALDRLCSSGRIAWARLPSARHKPNQEEASAGKAVLLRNTPITLLDREHLDLWHKLNPTEAIQDRKLSSTAKKTLDVLRRRGASFFLDLVQHTGLLRTQVETALAELAACGAVTSDSYAGLRALITPESRRPGYGRKNRRRRASVMNSVDAAGRWSAIISATENPEAPATNVWPGTDENTLAAVVDTLLKRYGVLFRKVLEREAEPAAVEGTAVYMPAHGSAGRDPRRVLCRGLLGRTVRPAGGHRTAEETEKRNAGTAPRRHLRRRPAEPGRRPVARRTHPGAAYQQGIVQERPAGRQTTERGNYLPH